MLRLLQLPFLNHLRNPKYTISHFFQKNKNENKYEEYYSPSPKLGRWKIDYNHSVIHCKIDQANEDHCGCINEFDKKDNEEKQKEEEYLLPYCI